KLNSGEIEALLKTPVSELNLMKYILNLLGTENLPTRVLASLNQLGTTLVGRPQLNGTVTIGGGIATYIARQIILGGKLESGRYKISLDQAFNSDDDMFNRDEQLASLLEKVKK